ncbi:MAG: carboxypeptidase-like regulatory domain-containing protein [Bacteroidetes bacterium]|nr:MAG: carboxypeptidase-like regulatory domain-containing protein [Bacteroidota bacterium]
MRRLELLLTLSLLSLVVTLDAQKKIISGLIRDFHSDEPIPFASVVFKGSTTGTLSDSAGRFAFFLNRWPSDTLEITCVGYQPFRLYVDPAEDSITRLISMERGTFNEGVKVRVRVNKGLLVWRKIVKHKDQNDRYRFDYFSYELYNKLEVDLRRVNFKGLSRLRPIRPVADLISSSIDSSEVPPVLPTYLTEALSDYYYQKKPLRRREVIKAANTNGVKNESIVKFLGGMDQNVDIYDNFIPVFDKQFVSPASDNGDAYYNYRVADTQFIGNHKFYHLVFTPRRHGENTFEGDCWVNDTTFAIQKMNLRLGKDANVNFLEKLSLIQEYKLINDSTWFLSKDKFVADLSPFGKESPAFVGRKTTTYKNVVVNDSSVLAELAKNKLQEEIITLPGATEKNKEYWIASRHDTLNRNEKAIVKMIDTLMASSEFRRFTNKLNFIGTGYLNVGNYQLGPWYNWVTYDGWEGLRLRFDLQTNKKFDRKLWLHAYLAYGFVDAKFKGQAEALYIPQKHPRLYLYGSYINDLDFGQDYYGEISSDNIFALAVRKNNIPFKYMNVEKTNFEILKEFNSGFSLRPAVLYKSFTPLKNLPPKDSFAADGGDPMTTFEVGIHLRFAYLEKFLESNFFRTSLGSPYPIPEIYFGHGIPGVFHSSYSYYKLSGSISDYFKIPPFGSKYFSVFGGRTFGTLPYVLLDIAPGNELYYYNKYAFNLMNKYEFIGDKYMGVNIEHNIGNGLFRFIPKLRFRQFWTAKVLWGSLSDANVALNFKEGSNFQDLNGRTYMELGTGVDNILHVLRIDFIWRVFPATLDKASDHPFGIFGSFRLSF